MLSVSLDSLLWTSWLSEIAIIIEEEAEGSFRKLSVLPRIAV